MKEPGSQITWRPWRYAWHPAPGEHGVSVRATDGAGVLQSASPCRPTRQAPVAGTCSDSASKARSAAGVTWPGSARRAEFNRVGPSRTQEWRGRKRLEETRRGAGPSAAFRPTLTSGDYLDDRQSSTAHPLRLARCDGKRPRPSGVGELARARGRANDLAHAGRAIGRTLCCRSRPVAGCRCRRRSVLARAEHAGCCSSTRRRIPRG